MNGQLLEKFEAKFMPEPNTGCWLWHSATNRTGYGVVGKTLAHRLAFEHYTGPIPDNLCVCHRCDNPCCVNPDHLFAGTPAQNSKDMVEKNRSAKGEQHGGRKLSDAEVTKIRKAFVAGVSQVALGRRFGVRQTTVQRIVRRKLWKHLP